MADFGFNTLRPIASNATAPDGKERIKVGSRGPFVAGGGCCDATAPTQLSPPTYNLSTDGFQTSPTALRSGSRTLRMTVLGQARTATRSADF